MLNIEGAAAQMHGFKASLCWALDAHKARVKAEKLIKELIKETGELPTH